MNTATGPTTIFRTFLFAALSAALTATLSACGGSGAVDSTSNGPLSDQAGLSVGTSSANTNQGQSLVEFTPNMGMQITYDDSNQTLEDKTSYIEEQWLYMQTCLQQTAQEPVVEIVDGEITPVAGYDEVIRHIDGKIQASAHVTDTEVSIQISAADFDGSIGERGSYLRSIMGRYLWLSANLSERDYPYSCALGE